MTQNRDSDEDSGTPTRVTREDRKGKAGLNNGYIRGRDRHIRERQSRGRKQSCHGSEARVASQKSKPRNFPNGESAVPVAYFCHPCPPCVSFNCLATLIFVQYCPPGDSRIIVFPKLFVSVSSISYRLSVLACTAVSVANFCHPCPLCVSLNCLATLIFVQYFPPGDSRIVALPNLFVFVSIISYFLSVFACTQSFHE